MVKLERHVVNGRFRLHSRTAQSEVFPDVFFITPARKLVVEQPMTVDLSSCSVALHD